MNNILLSIIIPTKNRYNTLIPVIEFLNKIGNERLEVIVQDNSDNNELFMRFLEQNTFLFLKYFYSTKVLSVIENSDLAVKNSNGEYVCFIGDDDFVTSKIIDITQWMDDQMIDVVTFTSPNYVWPDLISNSNNQFKKGILKYNKPSGKFQLKQPKAELFKLLGRGGQFINPLPQLYHGVVAKRVLLKVFNISGTFFPGPSPDMAVAVALALFAKKHYEIDLPVVISGTSKKSTGGLGFQKKHEGSIGDLPHLPLDTAANWNQQIPFFWSGPTIYAESVLQSLSKTKNSDLRKRFNFNYLYAALLVFNPNYNETTKMVINSNKNASKILILYYALLLVIIRGKIYFKNRIPFLFARKARISYLDSIKDVANILEAEMKNLSIPLLNKPQLKREK